jgi:lysyl endopeptidase
VPLIGSATAPVANRIDVDWTNGTPASTSFNVYRASGTCGAPAGPFVKIANAVPGFIYQDTTVSGGSTYAYKVTGILADCESGQSACVQAAATGVCTLPPTFAGLQVVTNPGSSGCTLNLSWTAATSQCGAGITYNVYRGTTPGFTPSVGNRIATGIVGTSYQDHGPLNSGQTYYYIVRAVDTLNSQEETNTVERSGAPTGTFVPATLNDTFEGSQSGGGFDLAGWNHNAVLGAQDWVWSTAQSQSPTHSWFDDSLSSASDRVLVSPEFRAMAGSTLSFRHTFAFEGSIAQCFDAGTLEITTNGGQTWTVVPDAAFTAGGFNGTANNCCDNPIGGKRAWCAGTVGAMTQVTVNLSSFAGQTARLRWHAGDDFTAQATGWFVDTVNLSNIQLPSVCSSTGIFSDGFESGNTSAWSATLP